MKEKIVLAPQKGPQEMFLATSADICIYGGAAGGGKTFGLLLEPLRYMNNPDYNATIFRRDYTQVTSPGGLWDSSRKIYRYVKGSQPLKTPKLHWTFKRGASVNFAHLGRDEDCDDWQGSQLTMIGFDELTHFSEYQFFYMLSRNRTDSGVKPYVRATCNPDADSWVAEFISWWINQETGYPIPERSGVIRWMVRLNEVVTWFDSREEAVQGAIENGVKPEQAETMPNSHIFVAEKHKFFPFCPCLRIHLLDHIDDSVCADTFQLLVICRLESVKLHIQHIAFRCQRVALLSQRVPQRKLRCSDAYSYRVILTTL